MNKIGDWICPNCKVNIFRSKSECKKCKIKKPEKNINNYNNLEYNKLYEKTINEVNEENKIQRENLINRAIDERLPRLYYVTTCSKCKSGEDQTTHNCWKYS